MLLDIFYMHLFKTIYLNFKINLKYFFKLFFLKINFYSPNINLLEKSRKNILFNTSYHWTFSWFEYGLMKKLSKDNNVTALVCDGMEYCELETITTTKPLCILCSNVTSTLCKSAGASIIKYSELLQNHKDIELIDIITKNNMKHYSKGNLNSISLQKKKKIALSGYKCKVISEKVFKNCNFDLSITANGKFIQTGYFMNSSIKNKINVVTYESFNSPHKMLIDINKSSVDQSIEIKDLQLKTTPNLAFLKNYALQFQNDQKLGKITPFLYHNKKAFLNKKEIFQKLNLSTNKKNKILLIPNVTWDSTCLSMDGAFEDIENWLIKSVYFLKDKDVEIIVRAHPAESKVSFHLKSNYGVVKLLKDEFGFLKNLKFIDSFEDLDTISLAQHCQKIVVYSSTIGIELPLYGIKPICPVKNYYTGFGFTHDTFSESMYFESLSFNFKTSKLSEKDLKNLYKLIYLNKEKGFFDMIENKNWPIKNITELKTFSQNKIFNKVIEFADFKKSKFEF